ncbi:unnamed protein product [Phytophthora lilii]|uniref:Unnamed protein product n=1 Tax=Phytophthora lilii TaxID=2077276 RepID=A0A9W6X8G1_9STRA|nr:unnamed protein product [Phytophthora lilii]
MMPLFNHYERGVSLVAAVEYFVPLSLRRWIVRRVIGTETSATLQLASMSLVDASVMRNVLGMAADEMKEVTELDDELVAKFEDKLLFVYSAVDEWVPPEFMQEYQVRFPNAQHRVVPQAHAFMMEPNGTRDMAAHISQWVGDVLDNKQVRVDDAMVARRGHSKRLVALWEAVQVELHGSYSKPRLLSLAKYASETTFTHAIAVMIIAPLPSLAVTIAVDTIPVANPFDGLEANKMFLLRQYLSVFYRFCYLSVLLSVPGLAQPIWRFIVKSATISGICIGVLYAAAQVIGFPLPFSILMISPLAFILTATSMTIQYVKVIKRDSKVRQLIKDVLHLWLCEALMAFLYPA